MVGVLRTTVDKVSTRRLLLLSYIKASNMKRMYSRFSHIFRHYFRLSFNTCFMYCGHHGFIFIYKKSLSVNQQMPDKFKGRSESEYFSKLLLHSVTQTCWACWELFCPYNNMTEVMSPACNSAITRLAWHGGHRLINNSQVGKQQYHKFSNICFIETAYIFIWNIT